MEETNKAQHLVIKYFDTYPVKEYLFDTEEEAREFQENENKVLFDLNGKRITIYNSPVVVEER